MVKQLKLYEATPDHSSDSAFKVMNLEMPAFYLSFEFREAERADIPWQPDLPHAGGSLLLMLPVSNEVPERLIDTSLSQ